MKNTIFTLVLLFGIQVAKAQLSSAETKSTSLRDLPNGHRTDEGAKVPEIVKLNFDKGYPNNITAWTIEKKRYMAEFKDSLHIGHIIAYNQYGSVLSVQDEMSPGAFPVPIDKYLVEHYPNQQFTIWSVVNADGTSLYYFTRESETVRFDPTGKFRNKTVNKLK
jgi:hypothetical protein